MQIEQDVLAQEVAVEEDGGLVGGARRDWVTPSRGEVRTDPEKRNPADFALWFKRGWQPLVAWSCCRHFKPLSLFQRFEMLYPVFTPGK